MKNIRLILPLLAVLLISNTTFATAPETNTPDDMSSSKINLWIPGFLMKMAAEIADDHVDDEADEQAINLLRKFGNTTICIREGEYYKDRTDKKMTRKLDRMERKNYSELMSVITADEQVNISIKENKKGKIKRVVVLVDEKDNTYVFLKMNCKLSIDDISKVCSQFTED